MAWIKLSSRYLNLDHVVMVTASTQSDGVRMEVTTRATCEGGCSHYFSVHGDDAKKLERALCDACSGTEVMQ